ncbi:MAG: hypothetical protein RIK87_30820 [Fuerstiella sp.]
MSEPVFEIVVATENNRYLEWQAMVFHWSCTRVMGISPVFVVHNADSALLPGYQLIRNRGGNVQTAPSLREVGGIEYPPRNTAATLQHVRTTADYIVLCDADMVFLKPLPWSSLPLTQNSISFDHVDYLNPNHPRSAAQIAHACRADGTDPETLKSATRGGVPHVIPRSQRMALSREWLRYMDLFPVIDHPRDPDLPPYSYPKGPHHPWLTAMWALILATQRLRLNPIETDWCLNNQSGNRMLPDASSTDHCLLHYCFGDDSFNKRTVRLEREVTDPEFWSIPGGDGTVNGFLRDQFRHTGAFFGVLPETSGFFLAPES